MKHMLQQVFHSPKFVVGFIIFMSILLLSVIYPIFVTGDPLVIIGKGTFFEPGIYVNVVDGIDSQLYSLSLPDVAEKRIALKLGATERADMKEWLVAFGIPEADIDTEDTEALLNIWNQNYDSKLRLPGMTNARKNYFARLDASIDNLLSTEGIIIASKDPSTGALTEEETIGQSQYINVNRTSNVKVLPLGTDNFGRDMVPELISAIGTSLKIGFIAGSIATLLGLVLGLVAGYVGGWVDDIILFVTNLFIVIPSCVLLILISYSIGQEQRGAVTVAVVIGFTSWVWTCRAVRSQVISLRNRDHVNLSKLSGHSTAHIIISDILPYVASYVVMAFILQISSGILSEAGLSILGLGPKTSDVATLGLMMNWAMIYSAHIMGKWWAYFPVIIAIALITFSMNLMNTGLDLVFNPTLRD